MTTTPPPRARTGPPAGTPEAAGIVVHSGRDEAWQAAQEAAKRLAGAGVRVLGYSGDDWPPGVLELRDGAALASEIDVLLAFGGDGTFLRAAYLARDRGVPLLGVNLGRLGFLSEVEAGDLAEALDGLLEGAWGVEERMTLSVRVHDADGREVGRSWALNEAAVERDTPQRIMVFQVRVGATTLADVPADAVICATPTGSTAYAFSARGPILSPLLEAIVLVPVAPHSLFDRTLVVDAEESLEVRPQLGQSAARVSLDGRESLPIPQGGWVRMVRGETPVRMLRLAPFDFYGRVRDKFGLH